MAHSRLAIVGLDCFLNQHLNSEIFSALIYDGKTIKDINHLDTGVESFTVLSKISHQALQDCQVNCYKNVAVITANNQTVTAENLGKHLSNLWNFSAITFNLDGQKDCLLKALEIAQLLLTAKEVDTVIISVVNSELNTHSVHGGAIIVKDYAVAQKDGDRIYAVLESFTRIADTLSPSSVAIQQSCQKALQQANISPSEVGYIEVCHQSLVEENSPEFTA